MATCEAGQHAYSMNVDGYGTYTGVNAVDTCFEINASFGFPIEFFEPDQCVVSLPSGLKAYGTVIQECEVEEPQTFKCTTEQPCTFTLSDTQWAEVSDWLGIFLAAACFFAFVHGFSTGDARA